MNREKIIKICNIAALILALGFPLKLLRDWFVHKTTLNSAPFYIWVLVDAVYFLLPAACIFLAGRLVQAKKKKESQENDTGSNR